MSDVTLEHARPRRGRRRAMTVSGAMLAVALAGGTSASYAAVKALDGGGGQPEGALPASVVAMGKIDMDPAFGQKRAMFQLSRKLPKAKAASQDSMKDDWLRSFFEGSEFDYDRDIKPWVGQRAAFGAVPDAKSKYGFASVAAIQYTDVTKTRAALRRLAAANTKAGNDPMFFALKNGYVLVAETQAKVNAYAASRQQLADVLGYQDAMAALGGDQIASGWVNVRATYLATPKADRKQNPLFASLTSVPTGYLVVGMHAASSFIEVLGKAVGTNAETNLNLYGGLGNTAGGNLLASYPADTWAGMDAVGLGDAMVKYYNASGLADDPDVAKRAKEIGITLPGDIRTLLGEETAVGVMGRGDNIEVVGRILSTTPAAAANVATILLSQVVDSHQQVSDMIRTEADGYYVGSSKAAVTRTATGMDKLGATTSFRRALPEAATSGLAVYVNIQGALRAFEAEAPERHEMRYLDAFGFTANPGTGTFRMRLTVK